MFSREEFGEINEVRGHSQFFAPLSLPRGGRGGWELVSQNRSAGSSAIDFRPDLS